MATLETCKSISLEVGICTVLSMNYSNWDDPDNVLFCLSCGAVSETLTSTNQSTPRLNPKELHQNRHSSDDPKSRNWDGLWLWHVGLTFCTQIIVL